MVYQLSNQAVETVLMLSLILKDHLTIGATHNKYMTAKDVFLRAKWSGI